MSKRRNPPLILKKRLIEEAGNKCANPGCSNYLVEIHHIREWHVYKTHDGAHMIAICPSCHDSITRGDLRIDDETLYNWKRIIRNPSKRDHIYVEPGSPVRLLFGSIAVETSANLVVFELPNNCKLSFEVINGDIAFIDLVMKAPNGDTLVSVVKNYIEYKLNKNIKARRRPGKFQLVLTDQAISLIPSWIISQHLRHDSAYFTGQEYTLLDIEVLEPGLVRIYGVWMDKQVAVVSSSFGLSFIRPGQVQPLTMAGEGATSVLKCTSVRLFELSPPVKNTSGTF